MPFKIVRNDITKMNTEAIVNTANEQAVVGTGCDFAVYKAAGYDELLEYRRKNIGHVDEGEVFITPGFHLSAKYIIHAVSPLYKGGNNGEEKKLHSCYRKSLQLAKENGIRSIAFPLISTGGFGYPKEEGMRIAADEINAFLLKNDMEIYLVVFGDKAVGLGSKLYPDLETYIDRNYVETCYEAEYGSYDLQCEDRTVGRRRRTRLWGDADEEEVSIKSRKKAKETDDSSVYNYASGSRAGESVKSGLCVEQSVGPIYDDSGHIKGLDERMKHLSDTYSEYLLYLIESKGMNNADVYKRAVVDRKIFSKIKNNRDYHPNKLTALCLCIGAQLNLDESRDLLARAGYALSPCDKTDVIFSFFIENKIYDMIELDIQLEEHDQQCLIS